MKLVFLGSPEPAVPTLRALVAAGHDVVGVVTQPDRRRGRGSTLVPTPVGAAARELGLPVWHDLSLVATCGAELGVVVAYGKIIKQDLLDAVPMINVHFSLLPRWRGAAPVERAILAGDSETGVCIMGLEAGLDTGPIYAEAKTDVAAKSASDLLVELAELGAALTVQTLATGTLPPATPQAGEPVYAAKLTAEDFALDPDLPSVQLSRMIRLGRAFALVNGVRFRIHVGEPVTGLAGSAGDVIFSDSLYFVAHDGAVRVSVLQPPGSKAMPAETWWRGARLDTPVRWSKATEVLG